MKSRVAESDVSELRCLLPRAVSAIIGRAQKGQWVVEGLVLEEWGKSLWEERVHLR